MKNSIDSSGGQNKAVFEAIAENIKLNADNVKQAGTDAKGSLDIIGTNVNTAATNLGTVAENVATVGVNIKNADDNSKTSLEALEQAIKEFTTTRTSDTTNLIAALNDYKTTLSADFGEVKDDLETIATNILAAKVRAEQFASIKRLADKIE